MEPNNFEKDFREKLKQRTIEPSGKAWDRLDAMLSVAEEKKHPKKSRKWLYIAASMVGFLLAGTFFFNQKENSIENPKIDVVIEENTKKDSAVKPTLNVVDTIDIQTAISEKETVQQLETTQNNQKKKHDKTIQNKQNQITESSIIITNNQEKQSTNNSIAIEKIPENESVDQLLGTAEKSIVAEHSAKPKSKIKINASDLLHQVDGELELSFREKVITKVNKNYQTVKVALANRNQQE